MKITAMTPKWKGPLTSYFDERASAIWGRPSWADLCVATGKEPRLWSDPALREDLARDIITTSGMTKVSKVLEVGCGVGFIARLIAPSAGTYEGIDLSPVAIQVARRLRLPNARFQVGDGSSLPFPDNSFDVVLCWDVVASFPEFEDAAELVTDMFRVVAPGGCALVGIVPDRDADLDEFMRRAAALTAELDRRYGPLPERRRPPYPIRLLQRLRAARRQDPEVQPWVGVYYFRRDEFRELGKRLAAETTITEMHPLHPYVGFRFNACYRKPK